MYMYMYILVTIDNYYCEFVIYQSSYVTVYGLPLSVRPSTMLSLVTLVRYTTAALSNKRPAYR